MSELSTSLEYLNETKQQIKQAIISKGQEINNNDTFRSYVEKINAIETRIPEEQITVDPTTSQQVIEPSNGKVINRVTVNAVTNSIDENITSENIKSGATILGVTGSSSVVDTSDSNAIAKELAKNKTAYVNGTKITGTSTVLDWEELGSGYNDLPQNIIDGYNYAKQIKDNWNDNTSSMSRMFQDDKNIMFMPFVDTSRVTTMYYAFAYCNCLMRIPLLDISNVTNMNRTFSNCIFKTIPQFNTSRVTNMGEAFQSCCSLTEFPLLNTSKCNDMHSMFYGCNSLATIPLLNMRSVTNASGMLRSCTSLTEIPQFNIENVTNFSNFTAGCTNLITVPVLDTGKVTNFQNAFQSCPNLSNVSLDNIMQMCINAVSYTGTKTLKYIGLSQTQAETCQTLSNWNDFEIAGWTTGY